MNDTAEQINPMVLANEAIQKARPKFEIAPEGLNFESEASYALQLLNNNGYLCKVAVEDPASLQAAMSNVASIGLSLNPAKAQAYLIPRSVKIGQGQWKSKIFLDPSYRGLCDIATGTGCVSWVHAEIYREGERFTLRGVNEPPVHERNPFLKERGEVLGAYCVAKLPGGDYLTECMSIEDLHKIRDSSESWKKNQSGPWKDWPEEMMRKSVVRRAFKMWPKSKEFEPIAEAVNISNENEGIEMHTSPEISDYTADQKHYYDQLITNSDGIGMFLFLSSIEEGVEISLYHSFERGAKGKYQQLVRSLQEKGRGELADYHAEIQSHCQSGDDLGVKDLLSEISPEAIEHIRLQLDIEEAGFLDLCLKDGSDS